MTVRLMLTCLCDAFYGEVGIATVRVLEHAGCAVEFPREQTCCGQPPFNAGDWASARKVAEHWKRVFADGGESAIVSREPNTEISNLKSQAPNSQEYKVQNPKSKIVVTPSSSCAAMVREGFPLMFGNDEHYQVYELGEFLVHHLGLEKWPLSFSPKKLGKRKVAYHRACHGRGLGLSDEQERLLRTIPEIEILPMGQPEQCCGFGGAFSVNHPTVSAGIGMEKLRKILESGATELVSGDMGCLMHLRGLIEREGLEIKTSHFAEVLADAIPAKVLA